MSTELNLDDWRQLKQLFPEDYFDGDAPLAEVIEERARTDGLSNAQRLLLWEMYRHYHEVMAKRIGWGLPDAELDEALRELEKFPYAQDFLLNYKRKKERGREFCKKTGQEHLLPAFD